MPSPTYLELWRVLISGVGFAIAAWGLWDALVDVMALYGIEVRHGFVPHRVRLAWRKELDRRIKARNGSLKAGGWFAVQRAFGRAYVILTQLVLSISAIVDGATGLDWKLLAQMSSVLVLSINAMSDRAERRLFVAMHDQRKTGEG